MLTVSSQKQNRRDATCNSGISDVKAVKIATGLFQNPKTQAVSLEKFKTLHYAGKLLPSIIALNGELVITISSS